jgi:uncharacterized protein (DUF2147 family)
MTTSRLFSAFNFAIVFFASVALAPAHSTALDSPIGLWKTIDDKTGKPKGFIRIYEEDKKFFGRIEKGLDGDDDKRVCSKCTDERKDKPLIGLVIMRNIALKNGEYTDGDILDPDNGQVYRCKFKLDEGGRALIVRGYIGISLIGRSQSWRRQE